MKTVEQALTEAGIGVHYVDPESGQIMIASPVGQGQYYGGVLVVPAGERSWDVILEASVHMSETPDSEVGEVFEQLFGDLLTSETAVGDIEFIEEDDLWTCLLARYCSGLDALVEAISSALAHGLEFDLMPEKKPL